MNRIFAKFLSLLFLSLTTAACDNKAPGNTLKTVETQISADSPAPIPADDIKPQCDVELIVLGHGQDAGKPQIGNHGDPAWQDPEQAVLATSIGLVNHKNGERYLFDATPDISEQSYALANIMETTAFRLDGIFLTHGHMGHYLGLAFLGREAMGAKNIPVYAMPKMGKFLRENGPWNLLISLENIKLKPIRSAEPVHLAQGIQVTPFNVPHRGEFTETVGYQIQTLGKNAVYLPDIDSWHEWDEVSGAKQIENYIKRADILFLDATFYSGAELPGRDMRKIPHPTIETSMKRFNTLLIEKRKKIHFIHLNHSNPALDLNTEETQKIISNGYNLARTSDRHCLYNAQ
ncbi:MAG: MBL fold metallo-hydrolase [Maricaulaceae bacterium]